MTECAMVGIQTWRMTYFSSFCLHIKLFHGIFNLAHDGVKSEVNVPGLQNVFSGLIAGNIFNFIDCMFHTRYFAALFIVSAAFFPELLATFYPMEKKGTSTFLDHK